MAAVLGAEESSTCRALPKRTRRALSHATVAGASPPTKKAAVIMSVSPRIGVPSLAASEAGSSSVQMPCIATVTEVPEPNNASEVTADADWASFVSIPTDFEVTETSLPRAQKELKNLMVDIKSKRDEIGQVLRLKVSVVPHALTLMSK
jgi:hypothetical protein